MNLTHLSRRQFMKLTGSALLTLSFGRLTPAEATAQRWQPLQTIKTALDARYIRQIITADSRTSRTIMWQADEPEPSAQVEYRTAGSDRSALAAATGGLFTDDDVSSYIYTAALSGLLPGLHYEYRLLVGDAGPSWYPLKTESSPFFKALIFPDSQCSDHYETWRKLAQNAARRHPDTAFYINMGDLVDNGEDHRQWQQWFAAVDGIAEQWPLAPLLGNHETYTLDWQSRQPRAWLAYFSVPANGSAAFPGCYYSFDYGEVHFAALDTQWEESDPLQPGLLAEEISWLQRDMKNSRKKWKIILMHKDILNYDYWGGREPEDIIDPVGRALMPVFDELGIDLVLSAHLHTYRRRCHIKNFQPDPAGPLYICTGVAGNVRYYDIPASHFDEKLAPQPETDNYLVLETAKNRLHLQAFLPNGALMDEIFLVKR